MISSTSHKVPYDIVQYLINRGGQLLMQDYGDEVTNNKLHKIPKFSSFIGPLVAGLVKTFIYQTIDPSSPQKMISFPSPKFVYRYVVISVEGFLLYFDCDNHPSQQSIQLFHSANIHGKINLNDIAYTVTIKSANQDDNDEVLTHERKSLRRINSLESTGSDYLHQSPSSSPTSKRKIFSPSSVEFDHAIKASTPKSAHTKLEPTKSEDQQLDFPIEFKIPSLSFEWVLYTENLIEQIRWYSALMKFLKYEPEVVDPNKPSTKPKKPPLLPQQVNSHPSVR